ncbi:MAG: extracellular solute-binding protein [Candidatus Pristimantibacillus sp.]
MTSRTILALVLCSVLLVCSACAKSGIKTEDGMAEEYRPSLLKPLEPTELVFWHSMTGTVGEAFNAMISNYNQSVGKENGIKVTQVYQDNDTIGQIKTAVKDNDYDNMPDISTITVSDIPAIMNLKVTVRAESFIKDKKSLISKKNFYPNMLEAATYQDQLIGVPIIHSTLMLYYNVDRLKEVGFDRPPATMDEMTTYLRALVVKEGSSVRQYGLTMQTTRYQLTNFIVSQFNDSYMGDYQGGRIAPMTKVTFGEDGTLRNFLTKLDDWVKTGNYKFVEDNINEEFTSGESAMAMMPSSRMDTIKSLVGDSFEWNTAYIPKVNSTDTSGASIGGSSLIMFNRGDHNKLTAAWSFIEYVTSAEVQAELAAATGYLPVNVQSENLEVMKEFYEANPQYKVALDQMKASSPNAQEPFDLVNREIDNVVKAIILRFCEGYLTVDEAIEELVQSYNNALDNYHRTNF